MKIALSCICLLAAAIAAHSIEEVKGALPVPDAYIQARERIFSEVSITLSDNIEDNGLVHVLMEQWRGDALVLLVVKMDGTARLIDSAGRNITPSGRKGKLRDKCSSCFKDAEKAMIPTIKTSQRPIPGKGCAMFYFFTVNRQYRYGTCEESLPMGKEGKSTLYKSSQECLAEVLKAEK
ncbi:MAG: hypothetical protein KA369_12485 [Spirochaetes bacterium]|nr:hypothetical protein [Spirochaetota bacterium]